MKKTINVEVDLLPILAHINDDDRLECVKAIIENIGTRGIIEDIRAMVNNPIYDD